VRSDVREDISDPFITNERSVSMLTNELSNVSKSPDVRMALAGWAKESLGTQSVRRAENRGKRGVTADGTAP
jgi:hypothetical protein